MALLSLSSLVVTTFSLIATVAAKDSQKPLLPETCDNTPKSRGCWGHHSIDTNYYTDSPDTGHTVEYWLSAKHSICNQDGYERPCMTFNGTLPGPTIAADWGDNVVVHVTNNLKTNSTSVHWHGIRMLNNVQNDGVPGISQCAVAPGGTFSYRFKATQYGTGWYHSHYSLQYAEGLLGPIVIYGPATANYDEDLGPLILQDWSHKPVFTAWSELQEWGMTHSLDNLLINGTNTLDCSISKDPNCRGGTEKFKMVFQQGRSYLIRLINVAVDSQFQFSIDGHSLRVIANDFVPIVPYDTDSVILNSGQRSDVIVEAKSEPKDYWIRGGWVPATSCQGVANDRPGDKTGILRYDPRSMASPTTISTVQALDSCLDEPPKALVPYLQIDVGNVTDTTVEGVNARLTRSGMFKWTINSTSLEIDWGNPTLGNVIHNVSIFPTEYNVVAVDKKGPLEDDEWAVLVIENTASGFFAGIAHPIHMHGHDFWILAQEEHANWDGTTDSFQTKNPPRRDTATLPKHGYLVIAFRLDNPGAWLVHCHIAWHTSQDLALEIVESAGSVSLASTETDTFDNICSSWSRWWKDSPWSQEDSGI